MLTNKPRLKAVESLVPPGARLLDIGADHGLLPLLLLARGEIKGATLTDINRGPLSACKSSAVKLCPEKMDRLTFILSDGFKEVPFGTYDFVTVCGMGGELIARIVEEGGEKAKTNMVLQPMSHHEKLRDYLWSHGFSISEHYVKEGKRVYLVLKVRYTGKSVGFSVPDLYLGKKRPGTAEYKGYVLSLVRSLEKRLAGLSISGNTEEAKRLSSVLRSARKILG